MNIRQEMMKSIKAERKKIDEVYEKEDEDLKSENTNTLLLEQKFNKLFYFMRSNRNLKETRVGLHASSLIAPDGTFCYRQQVLSLIYQQDQGHDLGLKSLQIFAAGDSIHEKWQNMFEKASGELAGIKLIKNEARSYDERYMLYFTPDTLAELDDVEYVIEYKSMNTFSFKKTNPKNPHPSARKQMMLYMYLKGIPNGLIVMEDKNDQTFKLSKVRFNYEEVLPYIDRANEIQVQYKQLIEEGIVPSRICKDCDTKRAKECSTRTACFFKSKRVKICQP